MFNLNKIHTGTTLRKLIEIKSNLFISNASSNLKLNSHLFLRLITCNGIGLNKSELRLITSINLLKIMTFIQSLILILFTLDIIYILANFSNAI